MKISESIAERMLIIYKSEK